MSQKIEHSASPSHPAPPIMTAADYLAAWPHVIPRKLSDETLAQLARLAQPGTDAWQAIQAELGIAWPIKPTPYKGDLPTVEPAAPTLVGDETPVPPESAENCICTEACSSWCRSPKCAPAASLVGEKGPAVPGEGVQNG